MKNTAEVEAHIKAAQALVRETHISAVVWSILTAYGEVHYPGCDPAFYQDPVYDVLRECAIRLDKVAQ